MAADDKMKNSQRVKQHVGNASHLKSSAERRRGNATKTLSGPRHKLPAVLPPPWMIDALEDAQLPPPAAVLVLLVLHLWRGLMPALWASTSNSLTSYMSQPTGWSGHSSLPAILRTVQPRLIFNTEAKRVNGLECEYLCVCVCVCGGEEFMLPNNSHFSSASIAAPISACWMLD